MEMSSSKRGRGMQLQAEGVDPYIDGEELESVGCQI